LFKAASLSAFNLLIPSTVAFLYGLKQEALGLQREVREVLSQSIHGVYVAPGRSGLVQLLPNLRDIGYTVLCPHQWLHERSWSALWVAFARFVKGALIPLAKYDIIHADIRAGYDTTANILYNPAVGSMRMIDLDSLCTFDMLLGMPQVSDLRNIRPRRLPARMRTALGFVLGQVVCVAEAWLQQVPSQSVNANANAMITEAKRANSKVWEAGADETLIDEVLSQYDAELGLVYGGLAGYDSTIAESA
jgi:hypothetical protein